MGGFAVFDIDGVLADVRHRLHHIDRRPKRWGTFFKLAVLDDVLEEGRALVAQSVRAGLVVVYSTGRPESYRRDTQEWLSRHGLPHGSLFMRRDHDRRPARVTKVEVARRLHEEQTVEYLVDDDPRVVDALRTAGFEVIHATWMDTAPPLREDPATAGSDDPATALHRAQEEGRV